MLRVLITGAASGFGAASAAELRRRGARVEGIDIQDGPGIIVADLRDAGQVEAAVGEAVERLGGLDVLGNNAGIGGPQDSGLTPDDLAHAIMDVNFFGVWRVTAAALPALLESRGRVVNIASGMAFVAIPYVAAYCASKHALAAYSDVLRLEYGDRLTVTTIYPGYVKTPIHRPSEELGVSMAGMLPEERLESVVTKIVRACTGRSRRDVTTAWFSGAVVFTARHTPRLSDFIARRYMRYLSKRGKLDAVRQAVRR